MKLAPLSLGFIPLIDAAPLVVAKEMGFAEEEGLSLTLTPSPSWSALRDRLAFGQIEAAHMLAPVPVASKLGLGGAGAEFEALSVLSINGNVIGVSTELAQAMRDAGHDFGFSDAVSAGKALIAAKGDALRVGVPFPFSMHAELIYYWLTAMGLPAPQNVYARTVPPPMMAEAMEAGEIDAFIVGEPWGSRSVDTGVAELLLPGSAIWAFAPEKVLAVRAGWAELAPDLAARLIRAVWRAARWLSEPSSRILTTELLSHKGYLALPPELLERAFLGDFIINSAGDRRQTSGFVDFFSGAASFPWRSQAEWIGLQIAARLGLDRDTATAAATAAFRSDVFRAALGKVAPDLPSASAKLEGAVSEPTAVGSLGGRLILPRDTFFDGRVFVPSGV